MDKLAVLFVMLAVVLAAGNLVDGRAPPPVLPAGPSPPANITSSAPAVQRPPPPVLPAGPSPPANISSSAPTVHCPPPPVLAAGPSPPANITSSAPAVQRPPPPVLPASKQEDKLNDKLKRQTKKNKLGHSRSMDKLAMLFVMLAAVLAAGNLVDGRAPPPVLPAGPSPPANFTSSAPAVQRPPPPVLPAGPSPPANITSSAPTVHRPPPPVLPAGPSPPANITSSAPAVHRPPPPVLPASKQEDKLNDKLKWQMKKNKLAEAGDIALGVLSIVAGVVVVWLKMRPARAPAPPHQQHPAIVPAPQQQEEHPAPQQQVVNNSLTISIGNK